MVNILLLPIPMPEVGNIRDRSASMLCLRWCPKLCEGIRGRVAGDAGGEETPGVDDDNEAGAVTSVCAAAAWEVINMGVVVEEEE